MLAQHWQALDVDERALEQQIAKAARSDREARRLMEVPCVGPIIASTVLAKVPDATVFRSGTRFCSVDRADRSRSRYRRQASSRAHSPSRGTARCEPC